jgi:hypothetical protein
LFVIHQFYEAARKSLHLVGYEGKVHIPDVPGPGLEWDEPAVTAHLADNF